MTIRRAEAFAANLLAGQTLAAWAPRAWFTPGRVVSAYWPFRTEIDPKPLMRRFVEAGATLALPATPRRGDAAPLHFRRWRWGDALRTSAFGVSEPGTDAETLAPNLLMIPLLAFDRAGGRLGYGAGHYDGALARLRQEGPPILAVGLAFAAQETETVPMEAHDQRLDAILTERGLIQAQAAGEGHPCA